MSASTRTFDFEIELKFQTVKTFNGIANEEYSQLFDFVNTKKLPMKNAGKNHASHLIVTLVERVLILSKFLQYKCSFKVIGDPKNDGKFKNEQKEVNKMDGSLVSQFLMLFSSHYIT